MLARAPTARRAPTAWGLTSAAPLLFRLAEAEAAATVLAALLVAAAEVETGDVAAAEEEAVCMALAEEVELDAVPGAAAPVSRPSPCAMPHSPPAVSEVLVPLLVLPGTRQPVSCFPSVQVRVLKSQVVKLASCLLRLKPLLTLRLQILPPSWFVAQTRPPDVKLGP